MPSTSYPTCHPDITNISEPNGDSYIYCLAGEVRKLKEAAFYLGSDTFNLRLQRLGVVRKNLLVGWEIKAATVSLATLPISWNIAASELKSLQIAWTLANGESLKTLPISWEVASVSTKEVVVSWALNAEAAEKEIVISWELGSISSNELRIAWSLGLPLSWSIAQIVASSLPITWSIAELVTKPLTVAWAITASFDKTLSVDWAIATPVSKSSSVTWTIN